MQRICFSPSQASVQNPNSHHLCLISISITVSWRLGKKRIKSKGFSYLGSSCVHGAKYTMVTWSEIESIIYSSLRGFLKINFFNVSTLGKLLNSVFIFLFFSWIRFGCFLLYYRCTEGKQMEQWCWQVLKPWCRNCWVQFLALHLWQCYSTRTVLRD